MFKQGFIMRQIQQFTDAIQQIIAKKKEGEEQEAQDLIEQLLTELQEDDKDNFHSLTLDETISVLEHDGQFNAELALSVADLLYEKGQLTESSVSTTSYMQALVLYQKAMTDPEVAFPLQAMQKIERIKQLLGPSNLEKVNELLKN